MTILTILQEVLGDYSIQNDEYLFACPFCHHKKKKLSVNIIDNKWKCWVCPARGGHIIWLLKKLNLTKQQLNTFREAFDDADLAQFKRTTADVELRLPVDYVPLWTPRKTYSYAHAVKYLKARNFTSNDILRYRIGYCEDGPYKNRIIIPSYDKDNHLNYFTGRSFYDDNFKYKNPSVSKNIIAFENMIDFSEPIVLCEGMFDAIALRKNAIPMMGKTLSKKLQTTLIENKVKDVTIFLDNDARLDAFQLSHRLSQYQINVNTVLTDEKDASQMGYDVAWEYIKSAKHTTFKDLVNEKLCKI